MSRMALRLRTMAAGLFLATSVAVIAPAATLAACDAWHYTNVHIGTKALRVTDGPYKNYNGTRFTQTHTFTSQTSVTVNVTLSVSASLSVNAVVASAEVAAKADYSKSLTATISNSVTMTVPAWNYANAKYGVWVVPTTGHLYHTSMFEEYYCRVDQDFGTISAKIPWYIGWYTWLSTN
jgi:hypothetical protein